MRGSAEVGSEAEQAPLAVELATLYPEDDGFFGRRAKRTREKLLAGIGGPLRAALAPGEVIRYAARGWRYGLLEYLFSGNAARYHNLVALVLTDRRLLMFHVSPRGRPADIKNAIPLPEITGTGTKALSVGWLVHLADGTTLPLAGIPKKDRARLGALLPQAPGDRAPAKPRAPGVPSMVPLCPSCLQPVLGPVGAVSSCPAPGCRIPFRDPRKAARLSAFVPGLGDLYLRHHFFGAVEFLGSMLLLGLGAAVLAAALADPGETGLAVAGLVLALFVVGPRVIDYFVTLHMGRKGLVPLASAPAPGAQARNLPSFPRWSPLLFAAGIAVAAGPGVLMGGGVRQGAIAREANALAAAGRIDEAHARWAALVEAGGGTGEQRVRFALTLLEAGDLLGADAVRSGFGDLRVEASLADRWNAALEEEQRILEDYDVGVAAFASGEERGLERLDRALGWFRRVKRPHLPSTRAELAAHLAAGALAPPLAPRDVESAADWLEAAAGAPPEELAAVEGALAAAQGEREPALARLSTVELATLPPEFRLLALEARRRLAAGEAERSEVLRLAREISRDGLTEAEGERLDGLLAPGP